MKYTVAKYTLKLIELEAENEYDALEQAKNSCTGKEQVGQVIQEELTSDVEAKVVVSFE